MISHIVPIKSQFLIGQRRISHVSLDVGIGLDPDCHRQDLLQRKCGEEACGPQITFFFCGWHPDVSDVCVIYIYNYICIDIMWVQKLQINHPPKSAFVMVVCLHMFTIPKWLVYDIVLLYPHYFCLMYNIKHCSWWNPHFPWCLHDPPPMTEPHPSPSQWQERVDAKRLDDKSLFATHENGYTV
jgi:hypothetical protein